MLARGSNVFMSESTIFYMEDLTSRIRELSSAELVTLLTQISEELRRRNNAISPSTDEKNLLRSNLDVLIEQINNRARIQ